LKEEETRELHSLSSKTMERKRNVMEKERDIGK